MFAFQEYNEVYTTEVANVWSQDLVAYQEISSGIASLLNSRNSEIRVSSVKHGTLNCVREAGCKFTNNASFVSDNDSVIAAVLKDTL